MAIKRGVAIFPPGQSPRKQAQDWDTPPLYPWQADVLDELSKLRARVAVSSCNESGKTNIIIPLFGLSIMTAFPGAIVFSTAGAEPQIKDQLWKYLEAKLEPYERQGWSLTPSDMTILAPKVKIGEHFFRSRWTMRVPKDAKTMQGLHGAFHHGVWCPVAVIIDEAHAVEHDIFKSAWRIDPDWLLAISTPPEEEAGAFFDYLPELFGKDGAKRLGRSKEGLWTAQFKITWNECPHLHTPEKEALKEALIAKFGADSSYIKSSLFGEVGRDSDPNRVFLGRDLDAIRTAMNKTREHIPGKLRAALDFSGGGDEQCLGICNGNKVVVWQQFKEPDTARLAKMFVDKLNEYCVAPCDCIGDNGGLGLAVMDGMEALGYRGIGRYMSNQEPINANEYADRISEDHYRFKEFVHKHSIILPDDPLLFRQMSQRKWFNNDHNKIKLELKKIHRSRTGESPDRLDTIIQLFSEWEMPVKKEQKPVERQEDWRRNFGKAVQTSGAFGWMRGHEQKSFAEQVIRGR